MGARSEKRPARYEPSEPPAVEDHLTPEDMQFRTYHDQVDYVLRDAFAPDVALRAIVYPSLFPEYAVGVKKDGDAYRIFSRSASKKMWLNTVIQSMKRRQITASGPDGTDDTQEQIEELEKSLPGDPEDVSAADRCEVALGVPLATRLAAVWKTMLLGTGARTSPNRGLDGETYHFAMPGAQLAVHLRRGATSSGARTAKHSDRLTSYRLPT
ncbi:MAG TPA: hypothetical protein VFY39_02005 [Gammaproteobacteria bacterium]|nr:hypothetical protein [Gammaproteobacteria bacterium]